MCGQFEGLAFRPHAAVPPPIGASWVRTGPCREIEKTLQKKKVQKSAHPPRLLLLARSIMVD